MGASKSAWKKSWQNVLHPNNLSSNFMIAQAHQSIPVLPHRHPHIANRATAAHSAWGPQAIRRGSRCVQATQVLSPHSRRGVPGFSADSRPRLQGTLHTREEAATIR